MPTHWAHWAHWALHGGSVLHTEPAGCECWDEEVDMNCSAFFLMLLLHCMLTILGESVRIHT